MPRGVIVKSSSDSLTSGGSTSRRMRRHSATAMATRSGVPISAESTAAMYSVV